MGMQTEATVAWGLHLDSDDVLAIMKALKEQEKIKQEEKQNEEKGVQDNRSPVSSDNDLEDVFSNSRLSCSVWETRVRKHNWQN